MKKTLVMIAVVALVASLGMSAYAYYGHYGRGWGMQGGMYGQQGGMMYGPRGGMRGGWGRSQGREAGWNSNISTCPCGAYGSQAGPGWNGPANPQSAPEMISEDKVKEVAQEYVTKYLTGYAIDKIEKDSWRPLYFVTLKGENAEQIMTVHGFFGQVMHVFPKVAE